MSRSSGENGIEDDGYSSANQLSHPHLFDSESKTSESSPDIDDVTPTNEGSEPAVIRPSAVVVPTVANRLRPVAKIIAKTKRGSREIPGDVIILTNEENFEKLKSNFDKNQRNQQLNSPQHQQVSAVKCGFKKPPPPPPKRFASVKTEECERDAKHEETPQEGSVKSLTAQFEKSQKTEVEETDSLPPPPEVTETQENDRADRASLTSIDSGKGSIVEELQSKLQRNESNLSTLSVCSTDSNISLPFAQENVGTIKLVQKQSKPALSSIEGLGVLQSDVSASNGPMLRAVKPPTVPMKPPVPVATKPNTSPKPKGRHRKFSQLPVFS